MDFTPYLTALVMLLGILVGTLISPRIQHSIGKEYNQRDLIFRKKLEFFEKIVETIERNKKLYYNLIHKIENLKKGSEINKILEELKENRKKFFIGSSPLYFNTKIFSEKIIHFVKIEKDIFNKISLLKEADKEAKERIIKQLKNDFRSLNEKEMEILYEIRKEIR